MFRSILQFVLFCERASQNRALESFFEPGYTAMNATSVENGKRFTLSQVCYLVIGICGQLRMMFT